MVNLIDKKVKIAISLIKCVIDVLKFACSQDEKQCAINALKSNVDVDVNESGT